MFHSLNFYQPETALKILLKSFGQVKLKLHEHNLKIHTYTKLNQVNIHTINIINISGMHAITLLDTFCPLTAQTSHSRPTHQTTDMKKTRQMKRTLTVYFHQDIRILGDFKFLRTTPSHSFFLNRHNTWPTILNLDSEMWHKSC